MNKYYVTQQTYNYNVSSLTIQMYWHEDENGNKVDIFFRAQTDKLYMPIREDSIYVNIDIANVNILSEYNNILEKCNKLIDL